MTLSKNLLAHIRGSSAVPNASEQSAAPCRRVVIHTATGPGDSLRFAQMMRSLPHKKSLVLCPTLHGGHSIRHLGMVGTAPPKINANDPTKTIKDWALEEGLPDIVWVFSEKLNDPGEGEIFGRQRSIRQVLEAVQIKSSDFGSLFESKMSQAFPSGFGQRVSYAVDLADGRVECPRTDSVDLLDKGAKYHPLGEPKRSIGSPPKLLFLNRTRSKVHPWRDTPENMADLMQEVLEEIAAGATVAVIGNDMKRRPRGWQQMENRPHSYVEQINALKQFDAVIGVNSGGLDLAAAAGLPTLRACAYHARKTASANFSGPGFNRFLAKAFTMDLTPMENNAWFDSAAQTQFKSALEVFLKTLQNPTEPKYMFVPPESTSVQDIEGCLSNVR